MDSPPAFHLPPTSSPLNGKMLVIAVVVLAAVILLILVMHLYAKWMWSGVSARQISMTRRQRAMGLADATRATPVTHGLDRAVIEALGTFKHSIEGDGKKDGVMECAVCLSEFEDGENGRLLPRCKHSFHVDCIDMWLHSNTTCPLCRASVQVEVERTEAQHPVDGSGSTILSQVVANLGEQQLENGVRIVQFPNNVLFWGNQLQCNAQTNSASNSGSAPSMSAETSSSATAPSHVTIDIPTRNLTVDIPPRPIPANMLIVGGEEASTASPGTTKSHNSGPLVTPSGRLRSLRRLLSRERRPTTSSELALEDSEQSSIHLQQLESQ